MDQLVGSGDALPDPPDASVVPFLDAACRAVERHGWSRTTMRDIAREAGVERTTVYRQVGSMPEVLRLLVAHEAHKLIQGAVGSIPAGVDGPTAIVELLAAAVERCWEHPILAKVVRDEPEVLAGDLRGLVPAVIARFRTGLSPVLEAAMGAGLVARRDPEVLTEWCVRVGITLLLAPPPGELRPFLAEVLGPVLAP